MAKNAVIVGGGLSGLITALQLARAGITCTVIERKVYPFHRVCGEYISNETVPFLRSLAIYPDELGPAAVRSLVLTSVSAKEARIPLALGGFGISRYEFDHFLYRKALAAGVSFLLGTEAEAVVFANERFEITAGGRTLTADIAAGCFGKRSRLDVTLQRAFIQKRSPYVGVKYHLRNDHPDGVIALHNFQGGYCGTSRVEHGKTNLCYLVHRDSLKRAGSLKALEEEILFRNPFIKSIFINSDFLLDKAETINEISFETKGPVMNHILMAGDAAGMITPLCGNGMAMAIHGAAILGKLIASFCDGRLSRDALEKAYQNEWTALFARRLWAGRQIQKLFGAELASNAAVSLARGMPAAAAFLVRQTHGDPF